MKHFRIGVGDVEGRASSSDRSMLFRPFESSAILSGIVDVTINEFPGALIGANPCEYPRNRRSRLRQQSGV